MKNEHIKNRRLAYIQNREQLWTHNASATRTSIHEVLSEHVILYLFEAG